MITRSVIGGSVVCGSVGRWVGGLVVGGLVVSWSVGRWVGGSVGQWVSGRWSVGRWSVDLTKPQFFQAY